MWASYDPYFLVYDSVHMRESTDMILSIYGKIRIRESSHFGILRSDKEEITVSNQTDFTILKFSFFQRLIVIELYVSEMIEKSYQNCFFLKRSSFLLFLFADCKSLQKQTRESVFKFILFFNSFLSLASTWEFKIKFSALIEALLPSSIGPPLTLTPLQMPTLVTNSPGIVENLFPGPKISKSVKAQGFVDNKFVNFTWS